MRGIIGRVGVVLLPVALGLQGGPAPGAELDGLIGQAVAARLSVAQRSQIRYWSLALGHQNPAVRQEAAESLAGLNGAVLALPELISAIQGKDDALSQQVSGVLAWIGEPAAPALHELLDHPRAEVRLAAASALLQIKALKDDAIRRKSPSFVAAEAAYAEILATAQGDLWQQAAAGVPRVWRADLGPAVPALLERLERGDMTESRQAAAALGYIGEPAAAALILALDHNSHTVQLWSLDAIEAVATWQDDRNERVKRPLLQAVARKLGSDDRDVMLRAAIVAARLDLDFPRTAPEFEKALPRLIESAGDEERVLVAAVVLGSMGTRAEAAVPMLGKMLLRPATNEAQRLARHFTAAALARIGGPAVPHMLAALEHDDPAVCGAAMEAIAKEFPDLQAAVPKLIDSLASPDRGIRADASRALSRMKPQDTQWTPRLVEALALEEEQRRGAAYALARYGDVVQPLLLAIIRDPSDPQAEGAVVALGAMQPSAAPHLIELLGSEDRAQSNLARRAILASGEAAVPHLVAALEQKNPRIRWMSCGILGDLRREALPAVPALFAELDDPDRNVRVAAAQALTFIAPELARQRPELRGVAGSLADSLDDPERLPWLRLTETLAAIGRNAAPATGALIRALDDPYDGYLAQMALQSIGPEAVPDLIAEFRTAGTEQRVRLADVLGGMRSDAADAVPMLVEAFQTAGGEVRLAAARALARIGVPDRELLPDVIETLSTDRSKWLSSSVDALGELAASHAEAAVALAAMLEHPDIHLRIRVADALGAAGNGPDPVVAALRSAARGPVPELRQHAAIALQRVAPEQAFEILDEPTRAPYPLRHSLWKDR